MDRLGLIATEQLYEFIIWGGSLGENSHSSAAGALANQRLKRAFPVEIAILTMRIYTGESCAVPNAIVRVFGDTSTNHQVAQTRAAPITPSGTEVKFPDSKERVVRVD